MFHRVSAVQPATYPRLDRRHRGGPTGGSTTVRPASATGAAGDIGGQTIYTDQTGGIHSVRPADQSRSDRSPSNSRVTFISAKSFPFLGIPTIHPPLVGLVFTIRSYTTCFARLPQVRCVHVPWLCSAPTPAAPGNQLLEVPICWFI